MRVLLIIPAYNEEENILKTYKDIISHNKKVDILVINDGSTDHTENILLDNNINHIKLVANLGIGGAVQTGYKYAYENGYDIAVQFDGDGQHDVNYIEAIVKPLIEGKADFVIGSRFIGNLSEFKSTKMRRFGIKVLSILLRFLVGRKITDPTSGFRAANKKIIKIFADNYPTEYPEPESIVTLLKNKYKVMEVPVKMFERNGGKSSIRSLKSIYYMVNVSFSVAISSFKKVKK